ncbi:MULTISPECIES: alpha/beta hydrolase [unclassified Rhizobium]|uniref:alpha/beta hydrolase n=1 Tax=unclassified Rhizobium TaxID=2613769 RepID=UPI001ADC79FB|nr:MULTISPECIES: alpha/beta hydrolase [unclassified Rhizobium]MBO9096888.1 alpha/beta hydrolase [Rhizobium sp. L58/93]MBO9134271.1 alpha/beta hydrolase [Rhizobium sp. B209b/85]MBO9167127.1 alpha/beta hydrolase [Rhizobium sp. L245/93]MBO9183085.1 alpha/beta hydrolase [Rhizobium sp. E27B/91]QXZ83444.1 alpha/beta hydrolase [Rhizobium sp. K1/93]
MSETANALPLETITVGSGDGARPIAMRLRETSNPEKQATVLWLSGYRSDMAGSKAVEVDALAERLGLGCIRFDYSGHGVSGGEFRDGTISRWLEETLAVVDHANPQRLVIVGSSMGGWIALRLIQELRARKSGPDIKGLVLIAPAPDFTIDLIEPNLKDVERQALAEKGFFEEPSAYSPIPNIYTRKLIEDGRANQVLSGMIETGCPVHILQGMQDQDVPHAHAMKLVEHLPADDVVLTLIRDGDHRLSRPQDLERMLEVIAAFATL